MLRVDEKVAEAILASIKPDIDDIPKECRGEVVENRSILVIRFSCSKASILKALNNSFTNIVLMLLDLVGCLGNE
ncbi:CTAG/PCC1 family protein [Desulfurococcus amylolyticus]|uniref:Transcription factor Pcc1 n=1 Tax=Desulfurococcus amylolyticus DSM 16532 TaxID=768672 RepID=I3XTK6_DESAM|nr:CTAG/PCC1 family protein [Desulfurococcus amylolyticus]AFL67280.1 Transcription factor Pcc1 [Desulfurococcus amylolyticus DSM 16532]